MVDLDTPTELVDGTLRAMRVFAGYAGWGEGQLTARSRRAAARDLTVVVVAAAAVTAVLGLDATVVLLTPAAFAAAAKARLNARPSVYATSHLANSASLLLPISNLTNLLAFRASELSFAGFAARMALPWAVAIAIEWAVLRKVFANALDARGGSRATRRRRSRAGRSRCSRSRSGASSRQARSGSTPRGGGGRAG